MPNVYLSDSSTTLSLSHIDRASFIHMTKLAIVRFQLVLIATAISLPSLSQKANLAQTPIPRLVQQDGRYALLVDGKPYLMLGMQVNNSSAWPEMLPKVWPAVEQLRANTVEVPVYWEQWESTQGQFDASVLHTLLAQAREHHVHLVLLWFGGYKNGSGHYTPPFVKLNEARVPHVVTANGGKVDSLSPYSQFLLDTDRTAFAALMRELKAADPQHTVLMVQVENEVGTYGSVRDFSPQAQALFQQPVPQVVLTALHKQPGRWKEVFGADADEFFYAWSIASYVNQVAAAGKAINPLPIYINVATRNPINGGPGSYPSGGAVDRVIPIWKAVATAIDVFGIDLYDSDYKVYTTLLDLYHRPYNAMFVPETGNSTIFSHYFYAALGHGTIGWSVFGMDYSGYSNFPLGAKAVDDEAIAPFALNYEIFAPMDREIAQLEFEGKVQGVSEDPAQHSQTLAFGPWKALISYGLPGFGDGENKGALGNTPPSGGAMVAQLGSNEFLVTGVHCRVSFSSSEPGKQMQFVRVEEGAYKNGVWHTIRIWNGDQTDYGLNFTNLPQVLRVSVATY
jgi:beta-galactosidase GanA